MPEELSTVTKPATAYARRVRYWKEAHGSVPDGKIVVGCGDKLCVDRQHLSLRDKVQHTKWAGVRDAVLALDEGAWLDLREFPNDVRSVRNLRAVLGIMAGTANVHITIRDFPSGGIRIIRSGDWYEPDTSWPVMKGRANTKISRPAQFFLGFMRNRGELFHRLPICKVRGCVWPKDSTSQEFCRQHKNWYSFPMSMTFRYVEPEDFYNPKEPHAPYHLAIEFPVKTAKLEQSLKFMRNGYADARHKNAGETDEYSDEPERAELAERNWSEEWEAFFSTTPEARTLVGRDPVETRQRAYLVDEKLVLSNGRRQP